MLRGDFAEGVSVVVFRCQRLANVTGKAKEERRKGLCQALGKRKSKYKDFMIFETWSQMHCFDLKRREVE